MACLCAIVLACGLGVRWAGGGRRRRRACGWVGGSAWCVGHATTSVCHHRVPRRRSGQRNSSADRLLRCGEPPCSLGWVPIDVPLPTHAHNAPIRSHNTRAAFEDVRDCCAHGNAAGRWQRHSSRLWRCLAPSPRPPLAAGGRIARAAPLGLLQMMASFCALQRAPLPHARSHLCFSNHRCSVGALPGPWG
jgi:hypothetical protein